MSKCNELLIQIHNEADDKVKVLFRVDSATHTEQVLTATLHFKTVHTGDKYIIKTHTCMCESQLKE